MTATRASHSPLVLIMAAGTGGHVFPALAIAERLRAGGARVAWLASAGGLENTLLREAGMDIERIRVRGLRGKGLASLLGAPFMVARALVESVLVLRRLRPDCVLGMGGYVCGPAGLAAGWLGVPLALHEQNATLGFANARLEARARVLFAAFPGVFTRPDAVVTGNPLRADIAALHAAPPRDFGGAKLRLLALGGSLGARALNRALPAALARLAALPAGEGHGELPVAVWHQTGAADCAATRERYRALGLREGASLRVMPFIDDMAAAYRWAQLAVCRAGASTVSELAAARLPAVLVPYPHHADRQQYRNADWLVAAGAATLLPEERLGAETLAALIARYAGERSALEQLSARAGSLAVPHADRVIAERCLALAREHGASRRARNRHVPSGADS